MKLFKKLSDYWSALYPDKENKILTDFIDEIESAKKEISFAAHTKGWYKDAVVYSLYVDLFNTDFDGLKEKLNYLQNLGVNCLWLLPILDSPMKDAGFDIRDYQQIRTELFLFILK